MQTNTDYRSRVQHTQDSYLVVPELGLTSELTITSMAKSDSLPKYQSNTSAVRTQRLWDKFIAVGNDKGEEFSMQTGAAPAAASVSTGDDNGSICINTNTTKKNKVPFAIVVPIMMGRSLVVAAAYPKLPRSQRHSTCRDSGDDDSGGGSDISSGRGRDRDRTEGMDDPPRLSLHHSDRVFGEWPGGVGAGADAVSDASTDASSGSGDKGRGGGPVSGSSRGVGWFTFKMLCEEEVGFLFFTLLLCVLCVLNVMCIARARVFNKSYTQILLTPRLPLLSCSALLSERRRIIKQSVLNSTQSSSIASHLCLCWSTTRPGGSSSW